MSFPYCSEDSTLVPVAGAWACGPAVDDQPLVLVGEWPDCAPGAWLVGIGDFEPDASGAYTWEGYACAYSPLPDTAAYPGTVDLTGFLVLFTIGIALLLGRAEDRRSR